MAQRPIPFIEQGIYHILNRGVNKQLIFSDERDYSRFLQTLYYYQFSGPKPKFSTYKRFQKNDFESNPKIIEIICFCLMPNHFHLMLRQLSEGGVVEFMSKVTNSYTKYFNTRHSRTGYLVQGEFKAVYIETDEQLLHTSRYIHLNPLVADLVKDLTTYMYSSYPDFVGLSKSSLCNPEPILGFFKTKFAYKTFIDDHEGYARELHKIKHLLIDLDN